MNAEFSANNDRVKELNHLYTDAIRLARALLRDEQRTLWTQPSPSLSWGVVGRSQNTVCTEFAAASEAVAEQLSAMGAPEKLRSIAGMSVPCWLLLCFARNKQMHHFP